jgi:hypothetical protein
MPWIYDEATCSPGSEQPDTPLTISPTIDVSTEPKLLLPDGGNQPPEEASDSDVERSDEDIKWRTSANRVGRLSTTSGELFITETNLIFSPYPTGFGTSQNIGIPLTGIQDVDIIESWDGGLFEILLQGAFRPRLRVELKNDEEEVFLLSELDDTIEQISNVM